MNNSDLLILKQSYPLDMKVALSKKAIIEFVDALGEDNVYISFSGGKDSTVLLHLVRSIYPNIPAVFSNTGLEFPELVNHVKTFENVVMVRPKKSFKQVLETEGYPVISKKTSRMVRDLQNPKPTNEKSRILYTSKYVVRNEELVKNNSFYLADKWKYLVDAPFKISERCCDYLKKEPIKSYEKVTKRRPIIGTMANESAMRRATYIKTGCNAFSQGKETSTPLGFWLEQDILNYIVENNLDIPSVYGDIIKDSEDKLCLTGEQRTGCVFCALGVQFDSEDNRFLRLQRTHPKLHKYCIDNLGFGEVLDYINIKHTEILEENTYETI